MAAPKAPEPAQVVIAVLASSEADLGAARGAVEAAFAPVVEEFPFRPFTVSHYYEGELGAGARRGFWALAGRVAQESLPELKLRANELEGRWTADGKRRVNLDPGILDLGKFVLASCKPSAQRVYLRDGVFGELEYLYWEGTFRPLPWTYPDYLQPETVAWFNTLREGYRKARKE